MKRPPLLVLAGFALGLLSLWLGAVVGLPALLLAFAGLRLVNHSDGQLPGIRLAIAGLVLGGIGTLITGVGLASLLILRLESTSQRAGCMNHLRLIGQSLEKYAAVHKTFPAATRDPEGLAPARRLSWLTEILPLLGDGTKTNEVFAKLAARIERTRAWDDDVNAFARNTPVRPFLCPGHPDYRPHRPGGLTHYVGLAGDGERAADLKRDDNKAGVFGHDRGTARSEAVAGISFTLAVVETTAENGPWIAGDQPTVRGVPAGDELIGPGRAFGGLHRGYVHGLWLDGSVRPLGDDTPAEHFRRMARLRNRE